MDTLRVVERSRGYAVVKYRVSMGAMGWAKTLGTGSAVPNSGRAAGRGG